MNGDILGVCWVKPHLGVLLSCGLTDRPAREFPNIKTLLDTNIGVIIPGLENEM